MKDEKISLVIDFKREKEKKFQTNKEELILRILKKFIDKVPSESVNSSTFTLAIDAIEGKSDVFLIEHRREIPSKIETMFEHF